MLTFLNPLPRPRRKLCLTAVVAWYLRIVAFRIRRALPRSLRDSCVHAPGTPGKLQPRSSDFVSSGRPFTLALVCAHMCVCVRGGSVSVSLPHSPLVASQELGQLGGGECNVFPDRTLPDPRVSHGVYDPIGVFTYRITPV